jgi:site-specific DNA recombinase
VAEEGARVIAAGCYARKSTDEGDKAADAKSVTRQIERAREYAVKKGWRFDDDLVFTDDGISGAEFKNRPGLTRLLETVKGKHKLGVLIVSEQSRLGRDTIRTLALIQALGDAGVKIWSYLEDREIALDDEMGEVEQFMKSWAGARESRKAGQRVRDQIQRMAEQGKYTGGKLYGYTIQDGKRVVVPREAAVIRRIFTRRADGAGHFKIARELEKDGITSPRGSKFWSPTAIGAIVTNETYAGVSVWGRTKRVKRRGTSIIEPSPEAIIRTEAPALRLITPELWKTVQQVNTAATAATWRASDGRLKSRPTESKHLLPRFLACGSCGGSLYVHSDHGKEFLCCTNRHILGKAKCPIILRLPVPFAEKALMESFESALVGKVVMTKLEEVLEAQRAATQDPEPLRAEAKKLRGDVGRMVEALATGKATSTIMGAIAERETRIKEIEETLAGVTAIQDIDVEKFRTSVEEALTDWRGHLRKNTATAAQVLAKCLPEKLKVTPRPDGGWQFNGRTDYRKVLEEAGGWGWTSVKAAIEQLAKLPGSARRAR